MPKHKHNSFCGAQFCFHGAFKEKAQAVKKERATPGGFIRSLDYSPQRYAVLTKRNPEHVRLDRAGLRRFNQARDWMQENSWNYFSAQPLAQDAAIKYDVPIKDLLPAARKLKLSSGKEKQNGLFTRRQKRKIKQRVRHGIRTGLQRLVGIKPRNIKFGSGGSHPRTSGRSHHELSGTQRDVVEALSGRGGQGLSRKEAERRVRSAGEGSFDTIFRKAIKRNPDTEPAAVRLFRDFHGADPKEVIRREAKVIESGEYFWVGVFYGYDLSQFDILHFSQTRPNVFAGNSGVKLIGGNLEELGNGEAVAHSLHLFGGNQDLEPILETKFGIDSGTQLVDLGEIKNIWYLAKKHDDKHVTAYHHTFGEEEKSTAEKRAARPYLMYDRQHRHQFIVGGRYSIPLEGIKN